MKRQEKRFVYLWSGVTVLGLSLLTGELNQARAQTPAPSAAPTPSPAQTPPTGAAQPQKGSAPSNGVDQRLQALTRELEGTEKKIEEFSKLVAQERSRLPSESVLLDQYLFLQSQVQELGAKVEQLQGQPRTAPQVTKTSAAPLQPPQEPSSFSLSALLFPILALVLYDRLFNARRFVPLEERIEHLEDYAYGKDMDQEDPFRGAEKKEMN